VAEKDHLIGWLSQKTTSRFLYTSAAFSAVRGETEAQIQRPCISSLEIIFSKLLAVKGCRALQPCRSSRFLAATISTRAAVMKLHSLISALGVAAIVIVQLTARD
jgi:hypothetical protein